MYKLAGALNLTQVIGVNFNPHPLDPLDVNRTPATDVNFSPHHLEALDVKLTPALDMNFSPHHLAALDVNLTPSRREPDPGPRHELLPNHLDAL